jgi:hypothetical protein
MPLYTFDPLQDSRWDELVATHPMASAFHRTGWLRTLAATYGYRTMVLTSSPPGEHLSDGIVLCEINSWITGCRLVSVPFADHADPLLNDRVDSFEFTQWIRKERDRHKWKYVELRPLCWEKHSNSPLVASRTFWIHTLDLKPSLESIFRNLDKNCLQRRIRRAERGQLTYEKGNSEELLNDFYRLLMITRRRHQIVPQPREWFRNLIAFLGPHIEIRLARKDNTPIAAILTVTHRKTVVYKYGCSDGKFHYLAGMPFLFWRLIEESKVAGAEEIDFGRTDIENHGLIRFKDEFGAARKQLTYLRYPESASGKYITSSDLPRARRLFSVLPDAISSRVGRLLYRHMG